MTTTARPADVIAQVLADQHRAMTVRQVTDVLRARDYQWPKRGAQPGSVETRPNADRVGYVLRAMERAGRVERTRRPDTDQLWRLA